jgi:hypothetical protein
VFCCFLGLLEDVFDDGLVVVVGVACDGFESFAEAAVYSDVVVWGFWDDCEDLAVDVFVGHAAEGGEWVAGSAAGWAGDLCVECHFSGDRLGECYRRELLWFCYGWGARGEYNV